MRRFTQNFQCVFATDDVILTSCLHVCEVMGFAIEDKHLIKCLRVSSSNEYLILISMKCLITHKHTLKILCKLKHFPPRYKRKREWVFLLSEHQTKTKHPLAFSFISRWKMFRFVQNFQGMFVSN